MPLAEAIATAEAAKEAARRRRGAAAVQAAVEQREAAPLDEAAEAVGTRAARGRRDLGGELGGVGVEVDRVRPPRARRLGGRP
ncbi:MAG: hypothetical protein QF516_14205, partial [Pirellulaceae bacterium]|nr:hypothetical protein [Pirellulaceae bacterium]